MKDNDVRVDEFSFYRALVGQYDIWHIHFPENAGLRLANRWMAMLKSNALLSLMDIARRNKTKMVWTVHNLRSHAQLHPSLEREFFHSFTQRLDGFISLSQSGLTYARGCYPALRALPGAVIPHGHYRGEYPDTIGAGAREVLGIHHAAKTILFLGSIHAYKNVPSLIRAFRALEHPGAVLVIAGRCGAGEAKEVQKEARPDARIHLHLHHIKVAEVQNYFRAADLVVLPYREILNSGSALLALSYGRPVLVPSIGSLPELQKLFGREWVQTYFGELTANHLRAALDWALCGFRPSLPNLDQVSWAEIARQTLQAYEQLLVCNAKNSLQEEQLECQPRGVK